MAWFNCLACLDTVHGLVQLFSLPRHSTWTGPITKFVTLIVCDLLGEGMAGIFGPQSTESSSVVQSTCGALDVPYIQTRWEYRLKPKRHNLNLYPPPNALGEAYLAYVKEKNWKMFAILYESNDVMSLRKQRSAFDQVYEFDRGRILAYLDCGLSFRQISSHVGRNQTTVMWICDRWMQEGTTDRRGRSHSPYCITSLYIASTLNSQRYISEVLEPVVLPYFQGLATAIFQQDDARPHVTHIVQRFFVNHQIELLPWRASSPDLSLIENMWSMVAQRLTQITPPAATPDQILQRLEAAWSDVPQERIQSLFESMPRRVAAVISNDGGYSAY
ncbi:transposable element Tcb1 transposase [Trichonephila clavipes]|nr:transposable element Tcb1 transposase [Trichonephila clavipes]